MDLKKLIKEAEQLEVIRRDVDKKLALLGGLEVAQRTLKAAHAEAERLLRAASADADNKRADAQEALKDAQKSRDEQHRLTAEASDIKDKFLQQQATLDAALVRFDLERQDAAVQFASERATLNARGQDLIAREQKLEARIAKIAEALK